MQQIETYIKELLEKSTPEYPVWNIENAKSGKKAGWNYIDGCMIKAILELYAMTKKEEYLTFADEFISFRVKEDGSIDGYEKDTYNLDNVNAGKTLFELYDLTGKEKYRKAIDVIYQQIVEQPRTKEGNFWHKLIYPNQVWLDGLYMCMPFYMEYETRYRNRKGYQDIFSQFANVASFMRDKNTGLYYHGYDSSREVFWSDKTTGLSKNYWLRAMGWYTMALVDTLSVCQKEGFEKEYTALSSVFTDLIQSLLKYQDKSGMWYQVVDKGDRKENYLETSGSSIMAYALMKGNRLGFLDEAEARKGEDAFKGICSKYLSTEAGEMSLDGICLVAGLGPADNTRRDGTFEYYMSEPVVKNDAKGVAPFLLAYTELLRR